MEKAKTDNSQVLYKIRIYRDFEFPSFSIDKNHHMEDLYHKSLEEIGENFNKGEKYFEVELTQILPFTIKLPPPEQNPNQLRPPERLRVDYNFMLKELCLKDMENKYGLLDYNKNPDIYDKRTKTLDNGIDRNPYYLKAEVENFYMERHAYYNLFLVPKLI